MGVVYLAEDTRLGRSVAIKALTQEFTRDDQRRRRLRREARAAAALSHPGIATVYALEEFDDSLYIVSEYIRGQTLRSELSTGPLAPVAVLNTAVEIARALRAAHARDVVHRDLKPENVIRTTEGDQDPGFRSRPLHGSTARPWSLDVTAHRARRGPRDARVYVHGADPRRGRRFPRRHFRVRRLAIRAHIWPPPVRRLGARVDDRPCARGGAAGSRAVETCPPALERIIRRCLQKHPDQRYGATRVLLDELELARRDLAESTARPPRDRAASGVDATKNAGTSPLWWWQFHQGVVGLLHYAMLYPLWNVRGWTPAAWGSLLFFATLVTVLVAANLRFHLWFTQRFNSAEIRLQRAQRSGWIRGADWLFVLLLLSATAVSADEHALWSMVIVGVGVVSCLSFLIFEPAMTRAAFRRSSQSDQGPGQDRHAKKVDRG